MTRLDAQSNGCLLFCSTGNLIVDVKLIVELTLKRRERGHVNEKCNQNLVNAR